MPSAGILILLVVVGTWACVKGRAAGAAAGCAALPVLFVVSTPVGPGLPGVVAGMFSVLEQVTSPVLNQDVPAAPAGETATGARPVGVGR